MACILHAHLILLFKNLGVDDVNKTVASVVLSAQVRFFYFCRRSEKGAMCCL